MSAAPDAIFRPINRLLKMAVVGGVEVAVKLHIERGDDLNARDDRGLAPLMLAAARNRAGICRLLIEAGADVSSRDPFGNDALCIAKAAGAVDAAIEIESAMAILRGGASPDASAYNPCDPTPSAKPTGRDEATEVIEEAPSRVDAPSLLSTTLIESQTPGAAATGDDGAKPAAPRMAGATVTLVAGPTFAIDDETALIDLSSWEAEAEPRPPEGDASLAAAPTAIQRTISLHEAIDDSVDWAHFEAFLPQHAAPMPRFDDADVTAELRALLLRALREGSVPSMAVDDLSGADQEPLGSTSGRPLRYVLADLGAETDERFEYRLPHESFAVYVDPAETADEEEAVNEAAAFLEDLESRRNDPMRLYMREAQRKSLINAEEEVALAKLMEDSVARALDALAAWPVGILRLVAGVEAARIGSRPLNSVTSGGRGEVEPDHEACGSDAGLDSTAAIAIGDERYPSESDPDEMHGEAAEGSGSVEPMAARIFETAERLRAFAAGADPADVSSSRAALNSLTLKRAFLMELVQVAVDDTAPEAARFASAIRTLAAARDRMAGANLRLSQSLAKRFLYSGLPMDDLIQEANIGLLKAVDKFDWRRGYKFSTMATWWIRQQVSRAVADDSRTIRLPVHVHGKLYRVERERDAMSRELGRAPSATALSARLGMPERKVEALLRLGAAPLAIDETDETGSGRFDSLEDESVADPFEAVAAVELRETLLSMLSKLDDRIGQVTRLRFGLDEVDAEPRTLEEVGLLLGVTRERIRQIEVQALRRLAHRNNRRALRGWIADQAPKKAVNEETPTQEDREHKERRAAEAPVRKPVAPSPRAAAPTAMKKGDRAARAEPSSLDKLLALASGMGILVEDDNSGPVRSTWINLVEARNGADRFIIRKLLAAGFELWPGKGYWK